MSVAALSTAGFLQYISASSSLSTSQQAWQALQQSLTSGNLTAAQSAFNRYNQLNQSPPAAGASGSSASSPLATDMTALGSAIGSGDLSTARSAFATAQNDLKTTPSQAMANAESAVAQTVQWVDDLINLASSSGSFSTPSDLTTAILDSAYGLNSSTNTTDPTVALLESKYGGGSTESASSFGTSGLALSGSSTSGGSVLRSGNAGSGASVNVYA